LLVWCAYWICLVLVKLGPALLSVWRMSQEAHGKGSVSAAITDGTITATVTDAGKTTWAGSISVLTLALLVAAPPLVLWLVWLVGSSRTNNAERSSIGSKALREPYAPDPRAGTTDSSTSKRPVREES
jgi:hypothetical protein